MQVVVAAILAVTPPSGGRRVVGLGGPIAAGKTTLAHRLADRLGGAAVVSTDVFLYPNRYLEDRDLVLRKGYPESYDWDRLASTVDALRRGDDPVTVPSYSHVRYDIEPGVENEVPRAPTVIFEGINTLQIPPGETAPLPFDLALYLHTEEENQRRWHTARLIESMRVAADRPESFYHSMAHWTDEQIIDFAAQVWDAINSPNLHDHIMPSRAAADLVVTKDGDHRITSVR